MIGVNSAKNLDLPFGKPLVEIKNTPFLEITTFHLGDSETLFQILKTKKNRFDFFASSSLSTNCKNTTKNLPEFYFNKMAESSEFEPQ